MVSVFGSVHALPFMRCRSCAAYDTPIGEACLAAAPRPQASYGRPSHLLPAAILIALAPEIADGLTQTNRSQQPQGQGRAEA